MILAIDTKNVFDVGLEPSFCGAEIIDEAEHGGFRKQMCSFVAVSERCRVPSAYIAPDESLRHRYLRENESAYGEDPSPLPRDNQPCITSIPRWAAVRFSSFSSFWESVPVPLTYPFMEDIFWMIASELSRGLNALNRVTNEPVGFR